MHLLLKTPSRVVELEPSDLADLQEWISTHLPLSLPMRLLYAGQDLTSLSGLPEGATVLALPNATPIHFIDLSIRYYRRVLAFRCPADATVPQLKAMLQPRLGLDPEHMRVTAEGRELGDSAILGQAGPVLTVESALHFEVMDGFPVKILTLTGENVQLSLESNNTIEDIYTAASECLLVHRRDLRGIYAGKDLEGGRRLCDYNIVSHSRIHLVRRLRYS